MCYPLGAYWEGDYKAVGPWRHFVTPPPAATEQAAGQPQAVNTRGRLAAGGGGGGTKVCLCSPTSHPGSFRCRHHHGEYQWVNRLGPKPS